MTRIYVIFATALIALTINSASIAATCDMDINEIKKQIIISSKAIWKASTGDRCVCPRDTDVFDQPCGQNSAWSNRTSEEPKCYHSDVDINDLRTFCPNLHSSSRFDEYLNTACCEGHMGYCGCGGSFEASYGICCDGTLALHCNDCFTFSDRFESDSGNWSRDYKGRFKQE